MVLPTVFVNYIVNYINYTVSVEYAQKIEDDLCRSSSCAPSGARTLDPNIKSVVLYQLS